MKSLKVGFYIWRTRSIDASVGRKPSNDTNINSWINVNTASGGLVMPMKEETVWVSVCGPESISMGMISSIYRRIVDD